MARFEVRQPITTREPAIEVDAGLEVGDHRFSLVVVGASGRRSVEDIVTVRVQRLVTPPGPTPVPIGPTPGPIVRAARPPAGGSKPAKRPSSKRKRSDPK